MSKNPIFVLCCSRTGSSLLRYILDSHRKVYCPPELHLCLIATQLKFSFGQMVGNEKGVKDKVVNERINRVLNNIMGAQCRQQNKEIWAEKSILTIDHIKLVHDVFPRARYLCLFRSCLDQLESALDALKLDPSGVSYGFQNYLAAADSRINGLADYWLHKTSKILEFKKVHSGSCKVIRYESLALEKEKSIQALFKWLDLEWDESLIEEIFTRDHQVGAGDHKIKTAAAITADSVGKNTSLILENLTQDRIEKINHLHAKLAYDPIT